MFRGTLDGGQGVVGIQKLEYPLVAQFHDYFFDQTLVARDLDIFHFFAAEPSKKKKEGGRGTRRWRRWIIQQKERGDFFSIGLIQQKEWKSDDGQGEQRVSATGPVKECNGPQGRSKHKQHNVPHGKEFGGNL